MIRFKTPRPSNASNSSTTETYLIPEALQKLDRKYSSKLDLLSRKKKLARTDFQVFKEKHADILMAEDKTNIIKTKNRQLEKIFAKKEKTLQKAKELQEMNLQAHFLKGERKARNLRYFQMMHESRMETQQRVRSLKIKNKIGRENSMLRLFRAKKKAGVSQRAKSRVFTHQIDEEKANRLSEKRIYAWNIKEQEMRVEIKKIDRLATHYSSISKRMKERINSTEIKRIRLLRSGRSLGKINSSMELRIEDLNQALHNVTDVLENKEVRKML